MAEFTLIFLAGCCVALGVANLVWDVRDWRNFRQVRKAQVWIVKFHRSCPSWRGISPEEADSIFDELHREAVERELKR